MSKLITGTICILKILHHVVFHQYLPSWTTFPKKNSPIISDPRERVWDPLMVKLVEESTLHYLTKFFLPSPSHTRHEIPPARNDISSFAGFPAEPKRAYFSLRITPDTRRARFHIRADRDGNFTSAELAGYVSWRNRRGDPFTVASTKIVRLSRRTVC